MKTTDKQRTMFKKALNPLKQPAWIGLVFDLADSGFTPEQVRERIFGPDWRVMIGADL